MNPDAIAALIPVSAFVMGGLVLIVKYLTQARRQGSSDTVARLDALEHELTSVRRELEETQERVDFAERLLTQSRDDKGLNAGS
jgi:hypothetical protein